MNPPSAANRTSSRGGVRVGVMEDVLVCEDGIIEGVLEDVLEGGSEG